MAQRRLAELPKCDHCGECGELVWKNEDSEWTGFTFCSERCADRGLGPISYCEDCGKTERECEIRLIESVYTCRECLADETGRWEDGE